jgi:hypothetical protein
MTKPSTKNTGTIGNPPRNEQGWALSVIYMVSKKSSLSTDEGVKSADYLFPVCVSVWHLFISQLSIAKYDSSLSRLSLLTYN